MRALAVLIAAAVLAPAGLAASPPPAGIGLLQSQLISVVKRVGPSVVLIETASGLGSGVVFDRKGDIVTNNHVVEGSSTVRVTLASGKQYPGNVLATFPAGDLAVVKITAPGLRPITLAPSSKLQVGAFALAMGNPLGLRSSVTFGVVSALHRNVSEGGGISIPNAIQTSAPINPGNSGGALVDIYGRLIGIPTLGAIDQQLGGQAAGIGFAIPSDTVKDIASQIIKNGKVVNSRRAYMGVGVADTNGGAGVYVTEVSPGSPAARAGIAVGNVIVSIAGKPTPTVDELSAVLAGLKPGQTVKVKLAAPSGTKVVDLTLATTP